MGRVVVTGAAGFIGSHLCHHLLRDPSIQLLGIDNLRSGDMRRVPEEVEMIQMDIADVSLEQWSEILGGSDIVYHLAAEKYNSSHSTPEKLLTSNVIATQRLARASALAGVKRLVFTSSLYSYGSLGPDLMSEVDIAKPGTLYGASKLMGEGILRSIDRELGLSWNVARLFFIYGPWQFAEGGYKSVIIKNFERAKRAQPMVINGSGLQCLDYVYIDDCVNALTVLASSSIDQKIVNVSTGYGVTVKDLVLQMSEIAGSSESVEWAPPDWTEGSRRVGDPSSIRSLFGWQSKTTLRKGLESVWEWISKK